MSNSPLEVHMFPCLEDNYCYLLHDEDTGATAVIDTPDVPAIEQALKSRGWQLTHILNTHHHWDHAGGNLELKQKTGCTIVGPKAEKDRIPGIDIAVGDGDSFDLGQHTAQVFDTPGHTSGHIVYHFEKDGVAFVGDTLFSMGCGRLFEGTPEQMWHSLSKLLVWPDNTLLYCAHEYTLSNARFAASIDPGNTQLAARIEEVERLRANRQATIPTTVGLEKKTNPFLRPDDPGIRKLLAMPDANDTAVFAEIRRRKDSF